MVCNIIDYYYWDFTLNRIFEFIFSANLLLSLKIVFLNRDSRSLLENTDVLLYPHRAPPASTVC